MPAIAPIQELRIVYSSILSMRSANSGFYTEWLTLLYKADRFKIPFGYICQKIMDIEIHDRYRTKIRNQNHLDLIHQELFSLKMTHFEAYLHLSDFLKRNNSIGYNNICRMMFGETPEMLKGGICG